MGTGFRTRSCAKRDSKPGPAMPRPPVSYIRPGETDCTVAGRLQGRRDIPLNARGRAQGSHCGEILRDLFARAGRDPAGLDYVSSPIVRACQTMELARAALALRVDGYRREAPLRATRLRGKGGLPI